ncbi:putative DNA-binding transcriptional regulator AlpA [Catenulispora sp. MAP5-51]|uniref:helix-turn-helix transcriptional regulator n=1 Tax=Catenulispora sp. MAP5-51 TaxID=3156298 RepID=UPI003514AE05
MPEENATTLAAVLRRQAGYRPKAGRNSPRPGDGDRRREQLAQQQPVNDPAADRQPDYRDESGVLVSAAEQATVRTEPWLFLEEVREIYGFPESSLRYWRKTRTGPAAYRVGRRLRYPQSEIESWMREQAARDPIARSTKNKPAKT